jgi:hypothetical protein
MAERDENGQFKKLSGNEQMNRMMMDSLANKPGARLMARLINNDARIRREAEHE